MRSNLVVLATAACLLTVSCASRGRTPPDPEAPHADALTTAEWNRVPDSPTVLAGFTSADPDDRARAARIAGRIQHPSYASALARVARSDASPAVRDAALYSLGQYGLVQGGEIPDDAWSACADPRHGAPSATAVECLGKLADPRGEAVVIAAASDRDPDVRAAAADAAMRFRFAAVWRGTAQEAPAWSSAMSRMVEALLLDPQPAVRRAAAHACSRYGAPELAESLARAARDPDPDVRWLAVRALARSGDAASREAVLSAAADPDAAVRMEAAGAAGVLGAAERLPAALATDSSFHVRAAYARAAGRAAPAALLRDESPTVVAAAIEALATVAAVSEGFDHGAWPVRAAAGRTAARLEDRDLVARGLSDPDPRVRAATLAACTATLGRPEVRAAAEVALGSADLGEFGTAVELLAASELPDRVAILERAYRRADGPDGTEIAETIARELRRDGADRELLAEMARDPRPAVRDAAKRALGEPVVPQPVPYVPRHAPKLYRSTPRATVVTDHGTFEVELFPDDAPLHVANFVALANDGFYDGLPWHRVVPNFVVQGGDPQGSGWGGPGYTVPDEISRRRFERGTLGMPKTAKDTGGCQLFFTHVATPHLDGNYTAFGRIVAGVEVVDRIEIGDRILSVRVRN